MFGGPGEGTAVKILPAAIHRGENVQVKSKNNITHSILPYFSSFQRRVVKYIHSKRVGGGRRSCGCGETTRTAVFVGYDSARG